MGVRGGSGRLVASIMTRFPHGDPAVGLVGEYGLEAGTGQWAGQTQGGLRRLYEASPEGGAARVILHLMRAGLLPVRIRRPIARTEGRWPEGEAEGV